MDTEGSADFYFYIYFNDKFLKLRENIFQKLDKILKNFKLKDNVFVLLDPCQRLQLRNNNILFNLRI